MTTNVIHVKDAPEGWRENPNFVYIGRGNARYSLPNSKWGNPYRLDDAPVLCRTDEEKRAWAINAYAAYLRYNEDLQVDLPELEGKILVCYCSPKHCHGDVLSNWWNHLYCRRHKFQITHPSYTPRTIMIAGSRHPVSPYMARESRRLVLHCFDRADKIIVGDALGVDSIVADWAERLLVPYQIYGVTENGRGVQSVNYVQLDKDDLQGLGEGNDFTLRDKYLIQRADEVFVVWNGRSKGSREVYEYALQLKKKVHLIQPDKLATRQSSFAFRD
jgi:hypothetical protein